MTVGSPAHDPAVWEAVWRHPPSMDKDRARLDRERRGVRWRTVTAALQRTFGRLDGLRTIELGAGRGDLSLLLAGAGADVTLLDRSATVLEQAEGRFDHWGLRARFVQGDLFDALRDDGEAASRGEEAVNRHPGPRCYDVAVSLGVIEHFRGGDRLRTVQAHHAVLRPGGMAVISVPNAACVPYRLWKAYLEFRGWWPYGMEIPYTRRELARLAERTGFERWSLHCSGFRRSLGDHFCKAFLGWQPRWVDEGSRLDPVMGFNLLLLAWRRQDAGARRR